MLSKRARYRKLSRVTLTASFWTGSSEGVISILGGKKLRFLMWYAPSLSGSPRVGPSARVYWPSGSLFVHQHPSVALCSNVFRIDWPEETALEDD